MSPQLLAQFDQARRVLDGTGWACQCNIAPNGLYLVLFRGNDVCEALIDPDEPTSVEELEGFLLSGIEMLETEARQG